MKLYEVPNHTWIVIKEIEPPPPGGIVGKVDQMIKFHHIDGMYSYCKTIDGDIIHLAAWTEVEIPSDTRTLNPQTPT